MLASC